MTSEWPVVRALRPLVRRHAVTVGALVALGTVAALTEGMSLGLFIPLFRSLDDPGSLAAAGGRLGALLDAPFAGLPPDVRLRAVLLAIFGLVLARNLLVLAHGALLARLTTGAAHELRCDAFARVLGADDALVDRRDTGAWLNLLESQTWETAAALNTFVGVLTRACRIAVFGLGLVALSGRLTIAVVLALGAVSATVRLGTRRIEALGRDETRAWEAMAQRLVEMLRTRRTIRVFGRETGETARFAASSDAERRVFERLQRMQAFVPPASELLVAGLMLGVLWMRAGVPGELPVLLTFLALLYRLQPQVQQLDGARVSLVAAAAPTAAVMELLATPAPTRAGTRTVEGVTSEIRFDGVTFGYAGRGPSALAGASFRLRAGVTTALVGPSGAGKSTIVKLLLGLVHPTAGTIAVDGVPLDEVDLARWRARVAVVGQDLPLFDASVRENIAYGSDVLVHDAAVEAAARQADADAFIRALPEGYATRLGDDGVRLSGGQRQRIALARALLRDPDVLVLDEATNAVDGISASLIQRTLAEFGRGRTVLIVSHRLVAVAGAQDVIVLDAGRVVESGSAARVLAGDGLAARLLGVAPARLAEGA
jgi:ATP-binding cassette, subfamily B, bacterial MsbA